MTSSSEREADGRVTLKTAFTVLSDPLRRRILTQISESPAGRAEFALEEVVGPREDQERIQAALHHLHLPELEQHGFVDWDRETGTFTRGPNYDEIQPVVSLLETNREDLPGTWV